MRFKSSSGISFQSVSAPVDQLYEGQEAEADAQAQEATNLIEQASPQKTMWQNLYLLDRYTHLRYETNWGHPQLSVRKDFSDNLEAPKKYCVCTLCIQKQSAI